VAAQLALYACCLCRQGFRWRSQRVAEGREPPGVWWLPSFLWATLGWLARLLWGCCCCCCPGRRSTSPSPPSPLRRTPSPENRVYDVIYDQVEGGSCANDESGLGEAAGGGSSAEGISVFTMETEEEAPAADHSLTSLLSSTSGPLPPWQPAVLYREDDDVDPEERQRRRLRLPWRRTAAARERQLLLARLRLRRPATTNPPWWTDQDIRRVEEEDEEWDEQDRLEEVEEEEEQQQQQQEKEEQQQQPQESLPRIIIHAAAE
jgi:hypothetical protein